MTIDNDMMPQDMDKDNAIPQKLHSQPYTAHVINEKMNKNTTFFSRSCTLYTSYDTLKTTYEEKTAVKHLLFLGKVR